MEKYLVLKKKLPASVPKVPDEKETSNKRKRKNYVNRTESGKEKEQTIPNEIEKPITKTKKNDVSKTELDKGKDQREEKFSFSWKWLENSDFKDWLRRSNDKTKAFCTVCQCEMVAHKCVSMKHMDSEKHKKMSNSVADTKDVQKMLLSSHNKNVAIAELKLAGFVAKMDLPMRISDTLVPLLPKMFPDSKIAAGLHLKRTKMTEVINEVLGPEFNEELCSILRTEPFSLIFDETTDISNKKQCAVTVIYYNNDHSKVETGTNP